MGCNQWGLLPCKARENGNFLSIEMLFHIPISDMQIIPCADRASFSRFGNRW